VLVLDALDVVDGVLLATDVDVAVLVLEEELVVAVGFDVAVLALDEELVVVLATNDRVLLLAWRRPADEMGVGVRAGAFAPASSSELSSEDRHILAGRLDDRCDALDARPPMDAAGR